MSRMSSMKFEISIIPDIVTGGYYWQVKEVGAVDSQRGIVFTGEDSWHACRQDAEKFVERVIKGKPYIYEVTF